MCGRYALYGPFSRHHPAWDGAWLAALAAALSPHGRYNIAPSQRAPVLLAAASSPTVTSLRWGLIPVWARQAQLGMHTINARAETVSTKPAFRGAWRAGRRCLVPASGWYEWTVTGGAKQPHFISSPTLGNPLMFAGLWEPPAARAPHGEGTYTILTTGADAALVHLHPRQPLVLPPERWSAWLEAPVASAALLLSPPAADWRHHTVSRAVNNPRHEGPQLVQAQAASD